MDVPIAVGELAEPALDARCHRLHVPVLAQHDKARRLRTVGVGGLADQQSAAGALGQVARHAAQELELVTIEAGPPGFPVQREDSPRLTRPRAQADKRLLVTPQRLDREAVARAEADVAMPPADRATSASLLTSSWKYSSASHSRGISGSPSW